MKYKLSPYSLPVLPFDKMTAFAEESKNFGLEGALRWEDGRIHRLPQDYADMTGWEELSLIVIKAFNNLSEEEKTHCAIFADNYGEAGAILFYGKKYGLPEPISFNGSFLFWAPDSVNIKILIYVNDETEDVSYYFSEVEQIGRITNVYARESGMPVYLCKNPKNGFEDFYKEKILNLKQNFH